MRKRRHKPRVVGAAAAAVGPEVLADPAAPVEFKSSLLASAQVPGAAAAPAEVAAVRAEAVPVDEGAPALAEFRSS